jgi:hypothetical protein
MTIAVATTKTGFNQTTDGVESATMMDYANSVDNLLNNILNGAQAFDRQLFSDADGMAIVNGVLGVPTQALVTVSAESGTSDILLTIGASNNRFVVLKAATGHTIAVAGTGAGNIVSVDGGSPTISGDSAALLWCHNSQWSIIGSVGSSLLNNLTATVDPTPAEDVGDGYAVGSLWANTSGDRAFTLVDSSSGLAIWKRMTPPKNRWGIKAANTSALGIGISGVTMANSPANANDSTNTFITLPTTAVIGNLGGFITTTLNLIRPSFDPTIEIYVKTSADLTAQRDWIGLVDAEITNVDTLAATREFIGFRYSSVAADPGWMPVLNDGTTQNVGSVLGGAITVSTVYKLKIRIVSGGTPTAYFSVNDGAEQAMTTNFPAIATDMGAICRCIATTAAIRSFSFSTFDAQWG